MDLIFDIQDFRGLRVICTEEQWYHHILYEHSEMENMLEEVINAISEPKPLPCVYQDRDYPERQIYYRIADSRDYYTKVVVDFSNDSYGEVKTAFMPDSPKPGEVLI